MKKHIMSMTYEPKIEPVQSGECTQSIRKDLKFKEGDSIMIHGWSGTPYYSKWNGKMRVTVTKAIPIMIDLSLGIGTQQPEINLTKWNAWDSAFVDDLAKRDFIDPPNGHALRDVLFKLNDEPDGPAWYQVVRWEIDEAATAELRAQAKAIVNETH